MRRAVLAIAVSCALWLSGGGALSETPPDFRRPQVFVHPSIQTGHFIGRLGGLSSWGIGMGVTMGAQFGRFAASVTIDTDYVLSMQQPPPFDSGLQLAGVLGAVRYFVPFGDFRPFGEVGYRYIDVIDNALVTQTGPSLNFNALSVGIGFRYAQPAPFYVEVKAAWSWIFELTDSSFASASFSFGIRSIL